MAEAAYSAGETLAAIGRVPFEYEGPSISIPPFIDECLRSPALQQRLNAEVRDHASALAWSAAAEFAAVDRETSLVHCDYGKRNLLVRSCAGRWQIAAVLDWEFAVSASPLIDLGHMLRYEPVTRPLLEPHFSKGFTDAGGVLREDWRHLSKIFDLSALCEALTHDLLPPDIEAELVALVKASVTPSAKQ
jgi:fructokinase